MKIKTILTLAIASMVSVASFATGDPVPSVTKNPATTVSVANMPTRSEVLKGDYVTFKHDATKKNVYLKRQISEIHCEPTAAGLTGYKTAWALNHQGVNILFDYTLSYIPFGEGPDPRYYGYCWMVTWEPAPLPVD